jgi:gluconokinase
MTSIVSLARQPRLFVIMGVSGCGKSSVGAALAERLCGIFIDGDDLHSPANIAKMSAGMALTDSDRWPWLAEVGMTLARSRGVTLIGCSALKRAYRDRIREMACEAVVFIHLSGDRQVISTRMRARSGHFMAASMLDGQFAALEPPQRDEQSVTVDIDKPLQSVIEAIMDALGLVERQS